MRMMDRVCRPLPLLLLILSVLQLTVMLTTSAAAAAAALSSTSMPPLSPFQENPNASSAAAESTMVGRNNADRPSQEQRTPGSSRNASGTIAAGNQRQRGHGKQKAKAPQNGPTAAGAAAASDATDQKSPGARTSMGSRPADADTSQAEGSTMMPTMMVDRDEFIRRAETFFKNATRSVGMTKRGSDAAWTILMKYSVVDDIDPTRSRATTMSPDEVKRRRDRLQKMRAQLKRTLSESDRRKLANLERGFRTEIDRRLRSPPMRAPKISVVEEVQLMEE